MRAPAFWYDGTRIPLWARLLEPVYIGLRALYALPWRLHLRRAPRLPQPLLVIGNLTAGGSGKTPLVLALVQLLRDAGWHPGVISRGYGRSTRAARLVAPHDRADQVGDEPLLIARRAQVPLAVARRRVQAAALLQTAGVDILLADDGLQHRALRADVRIAVVDGRRRFGNGHLLPAGPLREPATALARMDYVLCNGGTAQPGEYAMQLLPQALRAVASDSAHSAPPQPPARVHALAGIGDPQRFFAALRAQGYAVIEHAFADHHAYSKDDFAFDDGSLPLLMTEKDAVKCLPFARAHWWLQPVTARLDAAFAADLLARLAAMRRV